ncbi:MAG: hypothetical protein QM346_05965 [Chloroflexota bacterium]|jgi:hypothetical protein|nr:hypothetical protein [Chloroflexota bacterium]
MEGMNLLHSIISNPVHRRRPFRASRTLARTATAPPFLALLTAAALADWLVTRTATRLAIFIPKTPEMIAGYQWLNWIGQFGSTLGALTALAGLSWIVREEWRTQRTPWLAAAIASLGGLSIVFLAAAPGAWLLGYYLLMLIALFGLGGRSLRLVQPQTVRFAAFLPALAMMSAGLHQASPALYAALNLPGPPMWSNQFYLGGECLVLAGALAIWLAYGRGAGILAWLIAALPAFGFASTYLFAPAMTATIVIWSNGLTLFLPWWVYALALWLTGAALAQRFLAADRRTGWAIMLLAAAGYAPQLSSQFHYGLIALWLLALPPAAEAMDRDHV